MAAENEAGKVSLGIELTTDSVASQAPKVEKAVEKVVEKAGKKAGKKLSEEMAKGTEDAGGSIEKNVSKYSGKISKGTGNVGKQAGKSFNENFEKETTGGISGIVKKIAGIMAGAFAAKKLFDFGKTAISLGSDLSEVQNVVDSTFGQGSQAQKAVNDFAQNAAAQFGLSETMAKRYAGTFGAMGKAFGFAQNDAAEMSTTLAGLSGDVASFYNITQDEAYTKLKSVFTGETESLKDLGVVMTQTALDQFALQNGFGRTTKSMSEQEKVALRYRFVLDKLSTASGDFSRTSGSWANQVRLLKLQFESLAATVGQVLIAALTPAIKALNTFMGALIKAANTFKSFVFSLFGLESQDMGTGAGSALPDALGDISSGASDASDALGDVGDAATGAGNDAAAAANEIKRSLASFDKITKLSDSSSSGGSSGGGGGSGSGGSGSSGGSGGSASLGDTSSALTNTAYSVASSNGPLDKIMQKIQALKDLFVNGFWEGLGDTAVFDSIRSNIEGIGKNLKEIFTDPKVLEAASNCADKIAENLGKVVGSVVSIGATIADNLTGGFNKYLEQHKEDIKNFIVSVFNITGDIADVIGNFAVAIADVFSVFRSDEAKQITADIINIFATGFGTVIETALKFARDVISNLTKPFTDNKDQIKQVLEDALGPISTIVSTISDTVSTIGRSISKLYDEHVKPLLDSFGDGISDLVSTFLDGWTKHIQPVLDKYSQKFKDVFEDHVQPAIEHVAEAAGNLMDIIRKMWDEVLKPVVEWVIENLMPIAGDLADAFGTELLNTISSLADGFDLLATGVENVCGFVSDLITYLSELDVEGKLQELFEMISNPAAWIGEKAIEFYIQPQIENNSEGWPSIIGGWWDGLFGGGKNTQEFGSAPENKSSGWPSVIEGWWNGLFGGGKNTQEFDSAPKEKSGWLSGVQNWWNGIFGGGKNEQKFDTTPKEKSGWLSNIQNWWNGIFGGGKNTQEFDAKGNAKSLKDSIPDSQKTFVSTADFKARKNGLTATQRTFGSVADFKARKNGLTATQRTFGSVADFKARKNGLTATQRTFGSVADFKAKKNSLSKEQKTFWSTADFEERTDSLGSKKKTFWSTANFGERTDNLGSEKKTFWSTAKFGERKDNLGSEKKTFWSTAKFGERKDSLGSDKKTFWSTAKFGEREDSLSSSKKTFNATAKFTDAYASRTFTVTARAKLVASGGVFSNGHWSPIQRFAEGGSPIGGQLFVAREAGPELVGTLGGHTAVMNNNQIVASVSSGVAKAISGISFYAKGQKRSFTAEAYLPRLADIGNGIRSDTAQLVTCARQAREAADGGRTAEMIELLKKILQILTELDPDIYIDGQKVTSRIVSIINAQTRATGKSAIIV